MAKLEWNGIVIEVKEGKKSPQIVISSDSKDVDIFLNEKPIFSSYEQEEYQYIPPVLRPFISERSYSLESDVEVNDPRLKVEGMQMSTTEVIH